MFDTRVVWYKDIIFRLGVVLVVLNFADGLLTWYALNHFARFQALEMNILLSPLSYSGWWVVYKVGVSIVVLVGLFYLRRVSRLLRVSAPVGLFVGDLILLAVVVNNYIGLSFLY